MKHDKGKSKAKSTTDTEAEDTTGAGLWVLTRWPSEATMTSLNALRSIFEKLGEREKDRDGDRERAHSPDSALDLTSPGPKAKTLGERKDSKEGEKTESKDGKDTDMDSKHTADEQTTTTATQTTARKTLRERYLVRSGRQAKLQLLALSESKSGSERQLATGETDTTQAQGGQTAAQTQGQTSSASAEAKQEPAPGSALALFAAATAAVEAKNAALAGGASGDTQTPTTASPSVAPLSAVAMAQQMTALPGGVRFACVRLFVLLVACFSVLTVCLNRNRCQAKP